MNRISPPASPRRTALSRLATLVRRLTGVIRIAGIRPILGRVLASGGRRAELIGVLLWANDRYLYGRRRDHRAFQDWLHRHAEAPGPQRPLTAQAARACARENGSLPDIDRSGPEFVLITTPPVTVDDSSLSALCACAETAQADFVYADEYVTGPSGAERPFFKPGFSIDLQRDEDFVGPAFLARRSALRHCIAGLGGQATAYAVLLKAFELEMRVERAAGAWLVHDRPRDRRLTDAQRGERDAHRRRCYAPAGAGSPDRADASLIIPTRDRIDLLSTCLDSLYHYQGETSFEVVVVDNGSVEADSLRWLERAPLRYGNLQVLRVDEPFNWSRLNNLGRHLARGRVGVFLNNDVEALDDQWLHHLLEDAERPDVGAAGALLLYPDGTIQHAGVVVGIGGLADHVYSGVPAVPDDGHVFVDPFRMRNVLCCTGACLAVEFDKFDRAGGFDENLAICGDVELCVRLHERGLLNVYDPRVRLIHHESATRSKAPLPDDEIARLRPAIQRYLELGDPFYNPRLSLRGRYPLFDIE